MRNTVVAPSGLTIVPLNEGRKRWYRVLIVLAIVCLITSIVVGAIITIRCYDSRKKHSEESTTTEISSTSTNSTIITSTTTDSQSLSDHSRTPATSSTGMSTFSTTTIASEYYISYGSATDNLLTNVGMSIDSILVYNQGDACTQSGYVTNISVNFLRPFYPNATRDELLWFSIITIHGRVRSDYSVKPSTGPDAPSFQSFAIPQRELTIYTDDHVGVGTFANDSADNINQLYGLNGRSASYADLSDGIDKLWIASWQENNAMGVALRYVVLHNNETSLLSTYGRSDHDSG